MAQKPADARRTAKRAPPLKKRSVKKRSVKKRSPVARKKPVKKSVAKKRIPAVKEKPAKRRTPTAKKPTRAITERKRRTKKDVERRMAVRVEQVQQMVRRMIPHPRMFSHFSTQWETSPKETQAIIDRAYDMLVDRSADPKQLARVKAEIRECHRHAYGKLIAEPDWRAWSAAGKPLDYLAKLDGLYEPERQELSVGHHAELAHMGYTNEEEMCAAIDLGLQQAFDAGTFDGDE